jgi:AcrR family transcriptional regulator
MIIDATKRIVETSGASELSARVIAREIGYAPGTLYNLFKNLDDILLRVEAELLEKLDHSLAAAIDGRKTPDAIRYFASGYAGFAFEHARLWHLVLTHQPQFSNGAPDWYLEKVYAPAARLEPMLAKITGNDDSEGITRAARLIWSAIHGMVQVVTTEKFGAMSRTTGTAMVEDLVENYLIGLAATKGIETSKPSLRKSSLQRYAD